MKEIGETICKKGMAVKYGAMELNILEIIRKAKSIIMESMNGQITVNMKAIGSTIRLKDLGAIHGRTAESMKDIG